MACCDRILEVLISSRGMKQTIYIQTGNSCSSTEVDTNGLHNIGEVLQFTAKSMTVFISLLQHQWFSSEVFQTALPSNILKSKRIVFDLLHL